MSKRIPIPEKLELVEEMLHDLDTDARKLAVDIQKARGLPDTTIAFMRAQRDRIQKKATVLRYIVGEYRYMCGMDRKA